MATIPGADWLTRSAAGEIRGLLVADDPWTIERLSGLGLWHRLPPRVVRSAGEALSSLGGDGSAPGPDIVLIDVGLRETDPLVLCARLRARAETPVVMVGGAASPSRAVVALKLGADGVIPADVDVDELEARLEAVLRRCAPRPDEGWRPASAAVQVGDLVVEPALQRARVGGSTLPLTPTELRLLAVFAQHRERVLRRDEIARLVWVGEPHQLQNVDLYISRLRAKLRAYPTAPRITAIRGIGFRLDPPSPGLAAAG